MQEGVEIFLVLFFHLARVGEQRDCSIRHVGGNNMSPGATEEELPEMDTFPALIKYLHIGSYLGFWVHVAIGL